MKKSFTLIEILVVATIIGLLASGAIVSYQQLSKQSRDAKRKTDLEQVRAALEMYRSNNDEYISTSRNYNCANAAFNYLTTPTKYIESMPTDPKSDSNYYYRCNVSGDDYTIGAYLETVSTPGTCGNCFGTTPCTYCVGPYGEK